MCDDYLDDDYMDDDFYEDCEDMDACEEQGLVDSDEQTDIDEDADKGIPLDEFIFWGGFIGINVDEERKKSRKNNKKDSIS